MVQSVKQGSIKYNFLRLWYDSIWDWKQVSRAIGEHSTLFNIGTEYTWILMFQVEHYTMKTDIIRHYLLFIYT